MSLLETILYLGIAIFVLGGIFAYGWNVMVMGVKSQVAQEALSVGQLIDGRLRFEIRQAREVTEHTPTKIALQADGETVVIETLGGQITLKRGVANAVPLHSSNIKIDNFIFAYQLSEANEVVYVGFSYDVVADYPGSVERSEYQYSLPFVSGAALRTAQ